MRARGLKPVLPLCQDREIIKQKTNRWNGSFLVLQLVGQPVQALVQAVPAGGAGGLDVPVALAEGVQAQLVCDLCSVHGIGKVLKKKKKYICQICSSAD